MIYEVKGPVIEHVTKIFESVEDTLVQSYLQGHMGTAYVDSLENPKVAQIIVGIFVFYAGDAGVPGTKELLRNLPDYPLVIVNTDEWKNSIELEYKEQAHKFKRYRFNRDKTHFNQEKLTQLINDLPEDYKLQKINATIINNSSFSTLSEDFFSQFESHDDFLARGIGYCVTYKDVPVCGATSFSIYDAGIEIEIATDERHQRKGLAAATAASLILDCLEQRIYPNWDGAISPSVKLAEKLGYVLKEEYDTYFIEK